MFKIYRIEYNDEVVYVGRTKLTLKERKWKGYAWNDYLQSIKNDCEYILLEETDNKGRESYWVNFYLNKGYKLLNRKDGDNNLSEYDIKRKWYDNNLEKKKESDRLRYLAKKEEYKARAKERYYKNKER